MKEKVAEGLITQNPRTLTCYTKPKILKEGISENPVISSINCLNLKKLEQVDYHLQAIVPEIPSYMKERRYFFVN